MGSGRPLVELSFDQRQLAKVSAELRKMADGKDLARQFRTELRQVAEPAARDAKAAITSAPARTTANPPLRAGIAKAITVQVRTTGRMPSVAIRAKKTPGIRGFRSAAKNFNKPTFRHPPPGGRDLAWVTQVGAPRWFDKVMDAHRERFHEAATQAIKKWADQAAQRMRSG